MKFKSTPKNLPKHWHQIRIGDWYRDLEYDVALQKEPVIQKIDDYNWITVNRYNCRVLNSYNLFMADFDDELVGFKTDSSWEDRLRYMNNLADKRDYRFEVYKTAGGYRILETSNPYLLFKNEFIGVPESLPWKPAHRLLSALSNDQCYIDLCKKQHTFRHRLDPKPWRTSEESVCEEHIIIGEAERHKDLVPILSAYDQAMFKVYD